MFFSENSFDELHDYESSFDKSNPKFIALIGLIKINCIPFAKKALESIGISEDEAIEYSLFLQNSGFINQKEIKYIEKVLSKKLIEKNNFKEEIELIIENLNSLTGEKHGMPSNIITLMSRQLKKYSVDDFIMVNHYFQMRWNTTEFSNYLRPITLYNGKFPSRVEEAMRYFDKLNQYKNEIEFIYLKYKDYIFNKFSKKLIGSDSTLLINEVPFLTKQKISFWLENGYSVEDIDITINYSIETFKKKEELRDLLTVNRILDDKFPERHRIIQMKFNTLQSTKESNSGSSWLSKQKELN